MSTLETMKIWKATGIYNKYKASASWSPFASYNRRGT
jgi:hypothetical protein